MEVGTEVWYKDKVDGWVPAIVTKRDDTTGQIKFTVQVKKNGGKTKEDNNILANKDQEIDNLKLMNTSEDSEVENLINLPFLHEPAILHCLHMRYNRSEIYTYTGPILIAVNPFKKVNLYGDQILQKYFNYGLQKSQGAVDGLLSPHPFAVADAAYRFMMSAIDSSYTSSSNAMTDQSILISGESGAGKTETTKIVLRYLTTVASESSEVKMEGSIMDKVLKSNPILEALGNAKTIRNDNSSRFGKFIELKFNTKGHLIGGFIRTYLLEKVRLTSQQLNERNFHIFYQMGVGGFKDKERWNIHSPRDFYYVNQGKSFGIERINDESDYQDLRKALNILKFEDDDQAAMLDILAGLLHLGQLKFDGFHVKGEDASEMAKDELSTKSLANAMRLLGIPSQAFLKTVTERTIVARDDVYQKKLTSVQASDARDSIARIVYGKLFDWVVATVNKGIKTADRDMERAEVAVLDIFGFECLTENSFEQLCINYTNETLQQQFNQFIFKQEQQIYEEEEIEWSFVTFPDNQDCIDLIDNKRKSLFRLLDDECMTAAGSDAKFAGRLINELGDYSRLSVSVQQKVSQQFSINHYAGMVAYTVKTFVDKNKDELPREAIDLMASSSVPLLKLIFTQNFAPDPMSSGTESSSPFSSPTKANALTSPTICTQFRGQLSALMTKINSTKPHYIRCIKPNDQSKADTLNRLRTTEQLRYGGVLEAVRVARSGFPVRFSHAECFVRYRPLANPFSPATGKLPRYLPARTSEEEAAAYCRALLDLMWDTSTPKPATSDKKQAQTLRRIAEVEYWRGSPNRVDSNSIQLGKTRVFLRKPAHDLFESKRARLLVVTARRIQASVRRWLQRLRYKRTQKGIVVLQAVIRRFVARRRFLKLFQELHKARAKAEQLRREAERHRAAEEEKEAARLRADVVAREKAEALHQVELIREEARRKDEQALEEARINAERERKEERRRAEIEAAARATAEARVREELEQAAREAAAARALEEEQARRVREEEAARVRALEQAHVTLANKSQTQEELIRELRARIVALESELTEERGKNDSISAISREQSLRIISLEASTDAAASVARERLERDAAHVQNLEARIASLGKELAELEVQCNSKDSEIAKCKASNAALETRVAKYGTERIESDSLAEDQVVWIQQLKVDLATSAAALASASAKNESLHRELAESQQKNASFTQELVELKAAHGTAGTKVTELDAAVSAKEREVAVLTGKYDVLRAELERESQHTQTLQSRTLSTEEELTRQSAETKAKDLEIAKLKTDCEALQVSLSTAVAALSDVKSNSESQSSELSSRLSDLGNVVSLKERELSIMNVKCENLSDELVKEGQNIQKLEARAVLLESEIAKLGTEAKAKELQIVQLKANYEALEVSLSAAVAAANEAKSSSESKSKEQSEKIKSLQTALDASNTRHHETKAAFSSKSQEYDSKINELSLSLQATTAAHATAVSVQESLQRELLLSQQRLESSNKELTELKVAHGILETKVTGLEAIISMKDRELASLSSKCETLSAQVAAGEASEKELQQMRIDKAVLETRLVEAESSSVELKQRIRDIEAESGVQAARLKELEIWAAVLEVAKSNESMANQSQEARMLAAVLADGEQQRAVLEKEKEHLEEKVKEQRQQIHDLEVQNAKKDDIIAASANQTARQRFTASIDAFRRDMMEGQGIAGKVYTMAYPPTDSVLVVKKAYTLCFTEPKTAAVSKGFFSSAPAPSKFPEIPSVNAYDIREVQTGLAKEAIAMFPAISEKARAGNLFVTVVYSPSMVLAVEVRSLDDRNFLVKGLRALVTEMQLNASASERDARELAEETDKPVLSLQDSVDRLSAQILSISHDIARKDEELIAMRNVARNHAQEDSVRRQLCVRLEGILIELEDARQGKFVSVSRAVF